MKNLQELNTEFKNNNFQLYKVGGCVRDKLLNRENHDIDLVTNATPEQLSKIFHTVDIGGKKFGITIIPTDEESFEVATFREDSIATDHRHPDFIKFSTIEKDAFRRDFTMNALYEDMNGKILDPTGHGLIDIKNNTINFCSEDNSCQGAMNRINEDHLRILRAFRFMAILGFNFSDSTEMSLEVSAMNPHIFDDISKERISQELKKLIIGKNVVKTILLMQKMGYLKLILPQVSSLELCQQSKDYHKEGNVFIHSMLVLANCNGDYLDKIACILHDIGKPATFTKNKHGAIINPNHENIGADMSEKILSDLKFSKEESDIICATIRYHMTIKDIGKLKKSVAWPILQNKYFSHIYNVALADEKGKITDKKFTTLDEQLKRPEIEYMLNTKMPEPLITGEDLIAMGRKPDKSFKRLLATAYSVQLNHNWTKEQIIRQMKGW
jgi:tRNA nucleotidyltransferase/poly(A) polymerase